MATTGTLEQTGRRTKAYRSTADLYREQWRWDRVAWASHCIDCYPGNCVLRVYVKDGIAWREEQAGVLPIIEEGVPDMNPMGCQKGAGWSQMLYAKERLLYPLKRVGRRGGGKWKRISWDQALSDVADAVLDAIQEQGPESIIHLSGCNLPTYGIVGRGRFSSLIGSSTMDLNAEMNDFAAGHYLTYGIFDPVSSIDDWFHAELIFIWFANPVYTRIPHQHYINEARYKGAEVVTVAPDFSPSAIHADRYVAVRPGSDAAFALGMAQVVMEERLWDDTFVKEQTDLPLLVRLDTRMYLRESDLKDGGGDEQFYMWDVGKGRIAEAPRGTLALGETDPALEGVFEATLKDGATVRVTPVFALAKDRLRDYTPEKASPMCSVAPDVMRELARKVARKRTAIICCLNNASKYYHGDLIERSELLLLALTGNWGRKGTGVRAWLAALFDGYFVTAGKGKPGPEATQQMVGMIRQMVQAVKNMDPTMPDHVAMIEMAKRATAMGAPAMVPPIFLWYYHCGFSEVWSRKEWHDPSMKRPFTEYWEEARDKGWWQGLMQPAPDQEPRVFIEMGGNALRRTRGGQNMLLKHLWPKLKMVAVVDPRMSTTAMWADIVLPASQQYEKIGFGIPSTHTLNLTFCDKAVEPPGEARDEWQIFRDLLAKVEERARKRGLTEYKDARGATHKLVGLVDAFTLGGAFAEGEQLADEMVRDTAITGSLPEGSTLETLREKGFLRFTGLGISPRAVAQASEVRPDETFTPFRWHVEQKLPYATLTRRAQFYIDHPWFLEAGEEMPCHKDPPPAGGPYPLTITSGHNRWSIHSLNIVNRLMLQTHRGQPHVLLNPGDATERGLRDGDRARVHNDMGETVLMARLSESIRPGQVIIYNGWEPYQFPGWSDEANLEPGMIKWLHLAGGYGHLKYWPTEWQPCPVARATRVEVSRLEDGAAG
ncbi:MAG: molybdopterin-dependent oxidoreductase [Dehalococcoidia bacterium]|nr:molybdopterin-dependent oxidoreductase [Dehalococcoidia bacterium]